MKSWPRSPDSISFPNRSGPTAPPMPVEIAKKNAIAIARISIGNVSLIVR